MVLVHLFFSCNINIDLDGSLPSAPLHPPPPPSFLRFYCLKFFPSSP